MKHFSFFLKKKLLPAFAALSLASSAFAQASLALSADDPGDYMSCTSIMVGKNASTDGSVMTSHTCDAWAGHLYRTWMNMEKMPYIDSVKTMPIYDGMLFARSKEDRVNMRVTGEIPTAPDPLTFLNTAYPCMNEKQLGIGETTINAKRELKSDNGMFLIEELERIVLQRCSTARDAIRLIDHLIKTYGYIDAGECLTIADKNEVWQIEMVGPGKDRFGGMWAAVRIPDDHVGVSANISRISEIDLSKSDYYMASDNVFSAAKELGLWDGKEPFKFWKVYGGNKAFAIREYFIFSQLAPSMNFDYDADELPFSIKPEGKVSPQRVMELLRSTYEGTQWDPTINLTIERKIPDSEATETVVSPYANPWMTRDIMSMYNAIKDSTVVRYRTVSVPQCSYSHVIQCRSWLPDAVGGIAWVSFDNPGQSPRIPIFAGNTELPREFDVCGQYKFTRDAAVWPFRRANKLSTVKWGDTRHMIENGIAQFEQIAFGELPAVETEAARLYLNEGPEACSAFLNQYTEHFFNLAAKKWWDMGDDMWVMFVMGF